jgi:LytTr DNA-binding domain
LVWGTLNEVTDQLQLHSLVQVHKSFVINLQHIKAVKYDELLINGSIICGPHLPGGVEEKISGGIVHHLKKIKTAAA